jgi:spore protease
MGPRTDLAVELVKQTPNVPPGVLFEEGEFSSRVHIERVIVKDEQGEKALGKPKGAYITLHAPALREGDPEVIKDCARAFGQQLSEMLGSWKAVPEAPALIVGLGNRAVTPDSLGPRTVEQVLVTRHLFSLLPEKVNREAGSVAAIAPGVLGDTGLESGEVIAALVREVKPGLVIAIDALAAIAPSRLLTTIQFSNTGIAPGAGVGNNRPRLDEASLGIPVVAVGVPMVVHARSIVQELAEQSGQRNVKKMLDACEDMFVTPKDIDTLADHCAQVLSMGLNIALHGEDLAYSDALDLLS